MGGLFSPDSKVMQTLNRITDLLVLNILFVVTCLPVITIGAASTAMYTVCFRFGEDWEKSVIKTYFKAFCSNFRQATGIWLILALVMALAVGDFLICLPQTGALQYMVIAAFFLGLMTEFAITMAFPLLSRFDNTVSCTLKNAVLLSLAYAPRTLLLGVLNVLPWALLLLYPMVLIRFTPFFLLIYFSMVAYFGSRLLKKPFAKLAAPKEEPEKIAE